MAGFGAPPPPPKTLEDVVRSFGNRLPKDFSDLCMCGSGETYSACCRPYHAGKQKPETPEICLRTRYTAFAYRLPIYIMETTDPSNADFQKDKIKWAKKLSKTSMFDTFDFSASHLTVGELVAGKDENEVFMEPNSFTLQPKAPAGARPITTFERTRFVRRKETWLFADGAVTSEEVGLRKRDAMTREKDVDKLQADIDYANALVNKVKRK
uniref:YchJ-like middle NTF2-like domain-containing protein n=1 Tax=Haptolina brevifila TaxID=156173 RepID=A0A7S2N745_9EUKA